MVLKRVEKISKQNKKIILKVWLLVDSLSEWRRR